MHVDSNYLCDTFDQNYKLNQQNGDAKNPEEYKRRLYQELLNRDTEKNVNEHSQFLTLNFTDQCLEHQYRYSRDITSCISLLSLPLTLLACSFSYLIIGPL